jgi:hypothetical protein
MRFLSRADLKQRWNCLWPFVGENRRLMRCCVIVGLLSTTNLGLAECQPEILSYTFIAAANGTMQRKLQCEQDKYTYSSHIYVKVLFYEVSYDELSQGSFHKVEGYQSHEYQVDDSREDQSVSYKIENGEYDALSMELAIAFSLEKKIPLKSMLVFGDKEKKLYQLKVLSTDESLQTPLGLLHTVLVEGVAPGGNKIKYWFWKNGEYIMVRQKIWDDGSEIFDATISQPPGNINMLQ